MPDKRREPRVPSQGPAREAVRAEVTVPVVFFLHRGSWADRYQAVTLAVTAAALGDRVTLALFFEPLRLWVGGRFDEGAPAEASAARVASLAATLAEARADLGLRVVACDTAIRLAGLDPDTVRDALDGVEPLTGLWRAARDGRAVVI
jgi:peroxiredoxin family protein